MTGLREIFQCLYSPRLYRVYDASRVDSVYVPGHLEKWGDQIIHSLFVMWNVGLYTSPILATVLYRRGYFVVDGAITIAKFLTGVGLVLAASVYMRGVGRALNPTYTTFLAVLSAARKQLNKDTKKALMSYDFEFHDWPVEFRWDDVEEAKTRQFRDWQLGRRSTWDFIIGLPCHLASFMVAHSFGLKLVYPGSISLLQYAMSTFLQEGRMKLVTEQGGERFKLRARDGNVIDSMFVDRRNKYENGSILVICAEGNAGFYEIGIMVTPIEANYSVLGYNHPGFGGSTGVPFPSQEQNAIDVVIQFAIHKLNFQPENILLFGWSIGGYSVSWAALEYPNVRGVILDATFDDILPLATARMPRFLDPIVKRTIRDFINLNNYQLLMHYPGPLLLVRRTEDEVICTEEQLLSSNRGNSLLVKILRHRYPGIVDGERYTLIHEWLSVDSAQQVAMWNRYRVNEDRCTSMLVSYIAKHSTEYPMHVGEGFDSSLKSQMALFLAQKYLVDYKSSHCTPLLANMFRQPWDISSDLDYVKV
ncbi:phosphatidylserine lipase ABHD16A [Bacillus rossius redtenbacheri]|uniref:phosphatidylserine lipase ABHD16A n=1 Tax=Bacillus rossius redtenbacheri TaxID=93214 RepID=UPI002FDD34BE